MGRAHRPDPRLPLGGLRDRRPPRRQTSAGRGAVPDHSVGRPVDRHHPAGQLPHPADLAAGFQRGQRRPRSGHAPRGGRAVRGARDLARLRQPFRNPPVAARRGDRRQHGRPRLRAFHRGQHPGHLPAGLLVHPDLRDAPDARGIRPRAGRRVHRGAVAATTPLRVLCGGGDPRVDLSAFRHQAASGRPAGLREGVCLRIYPGGARRLEDGADPQRRRSDPLDLRPQLVADGRSLGLHAGGEFISTRPGDGAGAEGHCDSRSRRRNRGSPVHRSLRPRCPDHGRGDRPRDRLRRAPLLPSR